MVKSVDGDANDPGHYKEDILEEKLTPWLDSLDGTMDIPFLGKYSKGKSYQKREQYRCPQHHGGHGFKHGSNFCAVEPKSQGCKEIV